MPDPVHPDRLDRMASSGVAQTESRPASPDEVAFALKKVLVTGALRVESTLSPSAANGATALLAEVLGRGCRRDEHRFRKAAGRRA